MIGFLKGTVLRVSDDSIIVDVSNVGYKVLVGNVGILEDQEIELYIYTHVREQEISLYGFKREEDMQIFELLLSVSGVGPKSAIVMVIERGYEKIIQAIRQEDAKMLQTKGVGKKTSEKILIELKNKVDKLGISVSSTPSKSGGTVEGNVYMEVLEALSALGYRKGEIDEAFKDVDIDSESSTQDIIKIVLSNLRK